MNKKFKSLKNRILLLTIIIILFTAISIGLSTLYQHSVKNLKGIIFATKNIEKNIIQLKNAEQDFLLNFNKASGFFISSNTRFENEFRVLHNNIKIITDSLSELGIIKNSIEALEQIVSLQGNLKSYSENFNELILAYKEKGFESKGISGNWQNMSTQLENKITLYIDQPAYANIIRLKNIEKEYLLSKDPELISELSSLSNDIQNSLFLAGDNDTILAGISNDLNKYMETAKLLLSIDERIGINSKTGIIYNLNNTYLKLNDSVTGLSLILGERVNSRQTGLYIILLAVIIILLAGIIFILQKMARICLFCPLTEISKYVSQLVRG